MSVLIDSDVFLGTRTHWQDRDGKIVVAKQQDVTEIVEHAKRRYNMFDQRARYGGDGSQQHMVATIPLTILMELHRLGILEDPKAFNRWLNDPDNRAFRTRPGRV